MRFALARGELEQVQRALDVHVMRGHRREFRAARQQRGEVKNQVHLELGKNPLEQVRVQYRAGELALHQPPKRWIERVYVERDHRQAAFFGEIRHQRVADFAVGAGDQNDGFAHG